MSSATGNTYGKVAEEWDIDFLHWEAGQCGAVKMQGKLPFPTICILPHEGGEYRWSYARLQRDCRSRFRGSLLVRQLGAESDPRLLHRSHLLQP
jgi:hypothetical protein